MIQKPEQYYDTRRHQLYYQWRESEYFSHQEPIYDRTREYIESLEAEHAKLRKLARLMWKPFCWAQSGYEVCLTDEQEAEIRDMARELGIEV